MCALRLHFLLALLVCEAALFSATVTAESTVSIRTTDFAPSPDALFSIAGKAEMAVYRAFREKYPNIRPEGNSLSLKLEGPAGEAPLLMSIAGRTAPDVIHVNTRQSGSYIGRNFLLPLDEYINSEQTAAEAQNLGEYDENIMYRDELEERVRPQIWDAVSRVDSAGKRHFYFLPFSYFVRVMAYNKTVFQEAGLDPDKDYPKTWDELAAVAQQIQNPGEDRYGIILGKEGGAGWTSLPFFFSMGSKIVEREAGTGNWVARFNDAGAVQAADFYSRLVDAPWTDEDGQQRYGVGMSSGEAWSIWDRGRIGMGLLYINDILINADDHISSMSPGELGLVPVPFAPSGQSITELHVRGLGVCATTEDPEKIAASWKFMRFVGSPAAERVIVQTYVENGYASFINPEKLALHGYNEYVATVPAQWKHTLEFALENSLPEPYGENCQVYIERASKPLQSAFSEGVPRIADDATRLARLQELYDTAVKEINEKMLGQVPEDVMAYRRKVASAVMLLVAVSFGLMFAYIWRLFSGSEGGVKRGFWGWLKKYWLAYVLLTPAIASIFVFNYYPLAAGARMAFLDYNVIGESTFVGVDNFAAVLFDSVFWVSILRTAEYVFWSLLLVFLPPIILALCLSELPRASVLFRVLYYLPALVSGLIVMLMWKMFFDPSEAGALNQVLAILDFGPQKWLQDKSQAMVSIIIPLAWAGMGPGCLIYLAALKTVPEDLYEASAIDGAGFLGRIWHITLPTIRPLVMIQLIFVLIGAFQSADNVLVMTAGGPDHATHVIGLEIFYDAYVYLRFGVAIAIAWILGFFLIGLTMFQMKRISRMTFTTAKS
ncbi:MAG: extracellular solute-binding protein [Puniceicoccaceae bacterium]|nr:MAG: extracellular solute-binding protein [Puniceicoccaceae bacterium]